MATTTGGDHGLFGDQVFSATDLSRRAGEVLNKARTHPVTISRNNEQFALVKREYAAGLVSAVSHLSNVLLMMRGVQAFLAGKPIAESMSWIKAFDAEDLSDMIDEVSVATDTALATGEWGPLDALIHEWRESAFAISSGVLKSSMSEPADPVPLHRPMNLRPQQGDTRSA